MVSSLNSALSALNAFGKKMGVHANNIANVNSQDFSKSQAHLKEGPHNTVQVTVTKTDESSPNLTPQNSGSLTHSSNVDLVEELPQTMLTKRFYQANAKTLSVVDDMLGSVIDIIE